MMLTVQSVQADVAGSYDRTCGDVENICWLTVGQMGIRHVAYLWLMVRCHVAQSWAATWHPFIGFRFVCKIIGVHGVRPPDLPHRIAFTNSDQPMGYTLCLVIYMSLIIFQFEFCNRWQGVGPGLSPSPQSFDFICDHTIYGIARQLDWHGVYIT
jgi:hypothetical protein